MSESGVMKSPPVNWSSFLEQVRRDYETPPAKGVAHGLQKDAIQNGWGARVTEKGHGWSLAFVLIASPDGRLFLTATDAGTTGLTGKVYDNARDQLPDAFPPTERLARFECMFDSGGNVGPGLFGRGKLIFNCSSKENLIYYDSLTKDGSYRFGKRHILGRDCLQYERVFENYEAREKLKELTGGIIPALEQPGTRIIIVNPVQDVLEAIHSGVFLQAIEETWWEIILKYNADISVTDEHLGISRAQLPKEFDGLPEKDANGWRVYYRTNEIVQVGDQELRIKHLHFLLPPAGHTLREDLLGISVHRRGMKIGPLQLSGIPDEISDRFFGYVQLMPNFEDLLAEAENTVHYGFAGHKYKPVYRGLKKTVQDHLEIFMQQLGYRKPGGDPDLQAKQLMEEAQADLNSILNGMGIPSLGTGTERESGIFLSVEGLIFPRETNYLTIGDEISGFWYLIRNTSDSPQSIRFEVFTNERDAGRIEPLIEQKLITVGSKKEFKTDKLKIAITEHKYRRNTKVGCTALITDRNGKTERKTFFFYIDLQPPEEEENLATIKLKSAEWPRKNSRRVDYNQSVRNLTYEVENNTALNMRMEQKIKTLWTAEKEPIVDILRENDELGPYEARLLRVDQITMSREQYQDVLRGTITLRCHAIALETTKLWEKGHRLAEHNINFYLNMDPSYGFFEEPEYFDGGPNKPRSETQPLEGSRSWRLRINRTHPAYLVARTNELHHKNYLFEEMARQTVCVLIRTNQRDPIRKLAELHGEEVDQMEAEDVVQNVAYCITDRILAKYYEGY
ncbi:MAG: hypothetical protein WED04_07470 [Promethearchaeati archaeon SRVP18_Atabeyarchaeia-1]